MERDRYANNTAAAEMPTKHAELTQRDLTWAECSLEQRIERLRQATRESREIAQVAYKAAEEALRLARRHFHTLSGEVCVPAEANYGRLEGAVHRFDPLK